MSCTCTTGQPRDWRHLLALASLVAAGLLAFSNGFDGQFFLDDVKVIVDNVRIRHVLPRTMGEWLGPRATVDFTLAVNYATGRLNPADYHAGNLLIHLVSGLILFGLLRRTLALSGSPPGIRQASGLIAWSGALMWMVHPLAGAAVQYVCQRYELMAGLCTLLTLYAVLRGATGGDRPVVWYAAAIGACLVGMSCKETMVVTPLLVLAYDRVFLAGSWSEVWARRRFLHIGLIATILYLALPLILPKLAAGVHDYQPEGLSLAYLSAQARVVSHYLRLSVWPHPLCLDYGWATPSESFGSAWSALPVVLVVVLTVVLFVKAKPRLGFLGLWFLLLLSPTSSVFPHTDLAFDHRMYLPLAALTLGCTLGIVFLAGRVSSPAGRILGVALPTLVVGVALGMATYSRNRDYQDAVQMWRSVLESRPDNTRAAVCLTGELYARGSDRDVILTSGRVLDKIPPLDPKAPLDQRRIVDLSKLLTNLGLAQLREASGAEAVATLSRAVEMAPGNTQARLALASAALTLGDTNTALREVGMTYNLAPQNPDVIQAMADLLAITGRPGEAVALYRKARGMLPDQPTLQCRLAWLLATCPDAAIRNGEEALRLARVFAGNGGAGPEVEALETLAAALAESGDPAHAAKIQAEVVDRLGSTPARLARLVAYRAGQPWRDSRLAPVPVSGAGR
jgi:tetratricopeptide (TPR) repeat protein